MARNDFIMLEKLLIFGVVSRLKSMKHDFEENIKRSVEYIMSVFRPHL